MDDDDNDEDLEAELAALAAGNDTGYKSRRSGKLITFYSVFYIIERNYLLIFLCSNLLFHLLYILKFKCC